MLGFMPDVPEARSLADALLDAHVAFTMARLQGDAVREFIEQAVDHALSEAHELKLDDVVTRQMIKDTVRTYASDLEPSGAIPELVGDIARALYGHQIHEHVKLGELLSRQRLDEMVDKWIELRQLRGHLVRIVVGSPQFRSFISELAYARVEHFLNNNPLTDVIPGADLARSLSKTLWQRLPMPRQLSGTLLDNLKDYLRQGIKYSARASEEFMSGEFGDNAVRDGLFEVWNQLKELTLAQLRREITSLDVEEIFVIGYEYWRELRKTPVYRELIDAGIDAFFDKYGQSSLRELLDELGVTREIMLAEGLRYGPDVLHALHERGLLERIVRRQLEPFYRSAEFATAVASTK